MSIFAHECMMKGDGETCMNISITVLWILILYD